MKLIHFYRCIFTLQWSYMPKPGLSVLSKCLWKLRRRHPSKYSEISNEGTPWPPLLRLLIFICNFFNFYPCPWSLKGIESLWVLKAHFNSLKVLKKCQKLGTVIECYSVLTLWCSGRVSLTSIAWNWLVGGRRWGEGGRGHLLWVWALMRSSVV